MQTTQKRLLNLVAPGIALCLIVLLAGCTPPERTTLENGSRLLAAGDAKAALVELNNALEFIGKNDDLKRSPKILGHLHNQLGLAHQELFRENGKTNHYVRAYQAYRFTTTNQNTPTALKQRAHQSLAWLYLERYDWNSNLTAFRANSGKAADELNKLWIEMGDDKFSHWLEKGVSEFHAGRLDDARESFLKAGEQDATALNGLGVLAAIDKRYETATKYFEKASRVDAKDVRSKLHMAIALQSMGQHQSALDSYQAYLNTVPDSDEKKAKVRTLVAGLEEYLKPESEPEPKEESVEEKPAEVAGVEPPVEPAEPVEPTEPAAPEETEKPKRKWTDRLNPARWFGGRKKDKTDGQISWKSSTPLPTIPAAKPVAPASTNATRVVNVLPTAVAYPRYAYLHPALPKAGDRQVAKTYFDDGAKAQKSKEWQRAKAAYLQATKSDPAWFEARFKLGQAAYYTGETSLALQSFENALSIDPNEGPARFNFAMSLVQGTYYADAAKELETFLQFDPNNIQAHLEAANLYAEKLYDVAKAAIHYKRVIGLNPEHPQAVNIRYWLIRNKAN